MALSWDSESEREFWRYKCRDDFWWFLNVAFGAAFNPEGMFLDDDVHKPICDWFQTKVKHWLEARKNPKTAYRLNLAVLVPRRVGKTVMLSKAGMMWLALLDSDLSIYIGSEKLDFAEDILQPIKDIYEGSDVFARFTWLYGNWYNPKRDWKRGYLVHGARSNTARGDPSFGTFGVETGLTGKHPDVIDLDDPTSYEKMASHYNWLTTVNNLVSSLEPVLQHDGMMLWPGTRYAAKDHFGTFLKKEGIKSISGMPMPDYGLDLTGAWDVYYLDARDPLDHDKPTIPTVWSEANLIKFERQDPIRYWAQVRNNPTTNTLSPLTRKQCTDCIVAGDSIERKGMWVSVHIDTAFKEAERQVEGDESVMVAWGHRRNETGDVVFLGGYGSHMWRADEFYKKLAWFITDLRRQGMRVRMITDEVEVGGKRGTAELAMRNFFHDRGIVMPPFVQMIRGKKKVVRIRDAAAFWQDGHVHLLRDAPGLDILIEQMSQIGMSTHDDWADASADVFHKDVYQTLSIAGAKAKEDNNSSFPMDVFIKGTPMEIYDRLQDDIAKQFSGY